MIQKELEIYLHIPFCVRKCHYCDFLSAPADEGTKELYMEALCKEITEKSGTYGEYAVTTIFIGGGTPSCVKPAWIARIMKLLKENYHLKADAEISMEINPGTVDEAALKIYYDAGINRLSIGLQSAQSRELACLGRIHSYEQFTEAYLAAREIGFSNINVDLMSGLPGQTLEDYKDTLDKITGLKPPPEHISAYSLIIEEGTPFYQAFEDGSLMLPEEEAERDMYELTRKLLKENGYDRYEISNYAKRGRECRHNIGYWRRKNYIGFGIGAASLVENVRFRNAENLEEYIKEPCACKMDIQELSVSEQMEEFLFLGLRLSEGVSYRDFKRTFGCDLDKIYGEVIKKHMKEGLLQSDRQYLSLTLRGMDVSNYVMADFLEP